MFRFGRLGTVLIVSMLFIASTSGYLSWVFSSLRKSRNAIRASWHNVESANGQRAELVTQVLAQVGHQLPPIHLDAVKRAHERIATVVGPRGTDHADRQLRAVLDSAWLNSPKTPLTNELQVRCEAANRVVDEAARDYNIKVTHYETLRKKSTHQFLCDLLGFDKESFFIEETGFEANLVTPEVPGRPPLYTATTKPGVDSFDPAALGILPNDRVSVSDPFARQPAPAAAPTQPEVFEVPAWATPGDPMTPSTALLAAAAVDVAADVANQSEVPPAAPAPSGASLLTSFSPSRMLKD